MSRSLGWLAVSWIESLLIRGNGDVIGQPAFPVTDDYTRFIVMLYGLDKDGGRLHDHAFVSRSKGLAKSELAAFIGIFDALGPARFDHWAEPGERFVCPFGTGFTYDFEPGEPVGRRVTTPIVQCIATEAEQAGEIYSTIVLNLREGPLSVAFPHKDDVGLTRINLPGGGNIKPLTASGDSKDGGKGTLTLFDEALCVQTPIPTPGGWTSMGELEVGDLVLDPSGNPVEVVKATDFQHDRACYRVTFRGGDSIIASDGHLWLARTQGSQPSVMTTGSMYESDVPLWVPPGPNDSEWVPVQSIEPVESVPVRCIAVDSDDHLFLAGPAMRVTHNTHLYKTPELHNAYATLTRNLVKRRKSAGTFALETSTMFQTGEGSVAEGTYELISAIKSGKFKGRVRQLFDHRYSDITPEELDDVDRVREALTEAYGEGLGWNDLDGMVDQVMDTRSNITSSFRYFFNSRFSVDQAWIAPWSWDACGPKGWDEDNPQPKPVRPGDQIVLGFDGSRGRQRGIADATALIACRISDGYLFPIEVWEQPLNYHKEEPWMVPIHEVDAAVRVVFKKYKVIAFFCDPAYWTPTIADWEARYGDKLPVKVSAKHPCELFIGGSGHAKRTVDMLANFEDAVLDRELKHGGDRDPYGEILTQHVYNARRKEVPQGITIRKETATSNRKLDAAMAAAIAWHARLAAVAAGYGTKPRPRIAVKLR